MCSAKKVKQVANIAAAVVNPIGYVANKSIYGAAKGGAAGAKEGGFSGAISGIVQGPTAELTKSYDTIAGRTPNDQKGLEPIPVTATPDAPEPPALPAPGISNLAEQRRRKRLSSLRMGILGNIRSGGESLTANLLTPSASAGGGGKTLLGQ